MTVADELQQMAEWWARLGAPVAQRLAPGLLQNEIVDLFQSVDLTPTQELLEFWSFHNGAAPEHYADPASHATTNWSFLSLQDAVEWYRTDAFPDVTGPQIVGDVDVEVLWQANWFPVCSIPYIWGLLADLDPTHQRQTNPIRFWSWEEPASGVVLTESLTDLLRSWNRAYETGLLAWNPKAQEWDYNHDAPGDFPERFLMY